MGFVTLVIVVFSVTIGFVNGQITEGDFDRALRNSIAWNTNVRKFSDEITINDIASVRFDRKVVFVNVRGEVRQFGQWIQTLINDLQIALTNITINGWKQVVRIAPIQQEWLTDGKQFN